MKLFKVRTRWFDGNETETVEGYDRVSKLMSIFALAVEATGNEDISSRAVFISVEEIIN